KTFGTASVGAVWILLEYPHGWGRHALEDSALPSHVKNFFAETLARIKHSRLLFVKTDRGRRDARMHLFVVRCRERSPFVVYFPHGLFYAHVGEEAGRLVAAEYGERRMVLEKFRGRACYSHHAQAAEFFVRAASGLTGVEALRFHSSERAGESSWRVRFEEVRAGRVHEATVARRLSEFRNLVTCHSTEEKPVTQFQLEGYG